MGLTYSYAEPSGISGLIFPKNSDPDGEVWFALTGAALPDIQPLTIIWRSQFYGGQSGYYTTFFHGRTDGTFAGDGSYFGCPPYPQNGTSGDTDHYFSVAADGNDDVTDENANSTVVTKGQWYTQAAVSNGDTIDFYWDLETSTDRVISHTNASTLTNTSSDPGLIFGDAPWNPNQERHYGILRGIQVYTSALDLADVVTEAANHTSNTPKTSAGLANVHYMNQNPTPSDISDKSGQDNNPAWKNANRPTLWEGVA